MGVTYLKNFIYLGHEDHYSSNTENYFLRVVTPNIYLAGKQQIKKGQLCQTFKSTDESSVIQVETDEDFKRYLLRRMELMSIGDQCMQMLLHLNDDFDDDLLMDAMRLLTDID